MSLDGRFLALAPYPTEIRRSFEDVATSGASRALPIQEVLVTTKDRSYSIPRAGSERRVSSSDNEIQKRPAFH
jgi:hypothetical protein